MDTVAAAHRHSTLPRFVALALVGFAALALAIVAFVPAGHRIDALAGVAGATTALVLLWSARRRRLGQRTT